MLNLPSIRSVTSIFVFFLSTFLVACDAEKPQGIAPAKEKFAISPTSATPGSLITLSGVDLRGANSRSIRVLINGKNRPFNRLGNGNLQTIVPVNVINNKIISPQFSLDVEVKDGNRTIERLDAALTVIDIPFTGTSVLQPLLSAYQEAVGNLTQIFAKMEPTPGIEDQYAKSILNALQNYVYTNGQLVSAIRQIETGDNNVRIMVETLIRNSRALSRINNLAEFTRDLDISEKSLSPAQRQTNNGANLSQQGVNKTGAEEVSDDLLARHMQFANVLSAFNSNVIDTDARSFSLAAAAGFSAATVPEIRTLAANISVVDYAISKLLVAMFPTRIDDFSLELASLNLLPGEITHSETQIRVINEPAALGVAEYETLIINALAVNEVDNASEIRNAVHQAVSEFMPSVYDEQQHYAQQNPQLNLSENLLSYPARAWWAVIDNPRFLLNKSDDETRIKGLEDRNEWQAYGTSYGQVKVYAETSALNDAAVFAFPEGMRFSSGAFGADIAQSGPVFPQIFSTLYFEVQVPVNLKSGQTGELKVRAGYKVSPEQFNWKQGLLVSLSATGGHLGEARGETDSEGYFSTSVRVNDDSSQMQINIAVKDPGNNNEFSQAVNVSTVTGTGLVTLANRSASISAMANAFITGDMAENNQGSLKTSDRTELIFNHTLEKSSSQSTSYVSASSVAHVEHNSTIEQPEGFISAIYGQYSSHVSASVSDEYNPDFKYADASSRNQIVYNWQASEHTHYIINASNFSFESHAPSDRFLIQLKRNDTDLVLFEFDGTRSNLPENIKHEGVLDAATLYTLTIDIQTSADARSSCDCGRATSSLDFAILFGD